MAHFTLKLIVPNNDSVSLDASEIYIGSTITDFTDQQTIYTNNTTVAAGHQGTLKSTYVTYTYDEQLSMHTNGQKELSFSMDDKVFVNEEYIQNPYARVLRVGSQIELTDKYNNILLFTVTKVDYTFKNLNITYKITCQDSFTNQLSKQNNGYVLTNDETSSDFIGALDIDEWAERVVKDCYITYEYIPLDTGIYQYKKDGIYYISTFGVPGDDIWSGVTANIGNNVTKIIKSIYNKRDYESFYETFPFSSSGGTANSVLIEMAEQLGLQLFVVEGYSSETTDGAYIYKRYFYFGPTKNPEASGLTYSPKQDIKDFSLSFSGDSLTTVLNVNSTTWDDEEIGLFPAMPLVLENIILNQDWGTTIYYPGFFIEKIKGTQYSNDQEVLDLTNSIEGPEGYIAVPIEEDINWSGYYNKITLYWDKEHYTSIQVADNLLTPFGSKDDFLIGFQNNGTENNGAWTTFATEEEIPSDMIMDSTQKPYLLIKGTYTAGITIATQTFYVVFGRNYTQEEVDFAEIAEKCPWLENKLVDFSYFQRQGIISPAEYRNIMQWLCNDLRIINGRLMCYASSYYRALHAQVKILATIESELESLSADFNHLVVSSFKNTGNLATNITSFTTSYNAIFNQNTPTENMVQLLNLNKIVSQKFNQYVSAEQRFLKNIYKFREYFNAPNIFATANGATTLFDVTFTIPTIIDGTFYSLKDGVSYQDVNDDIVIGATTTDEGTIDYSNASFSVQVYEYYNGQYCLRPIVHSKNYTDYYIPQITAGSFIPVSSNHTYNSNNSYYLQWDTYAEVFNWDLDNKDDVAILSKRRTYIDENNIKYIELTASDLKKIHVAGQLDEYYVRDITKKVPFDWVRTSKETLSTALDIRCWVGLSSAAALNEAWSEDKDNTYWTSEAAWKWFWPYYKAMLPIETLYVEDYDIRYTTTIGDDKTTTYTWLRYNQQSMQLEEITADKLPDKKWFPVTFINSNDAMKAFLTNNDITVSTDTTLIDYLSKHHDDVQTKYYAATKDKTKIAKDIWSGVAAGVASTLSVGGVWGAIGWLTYFIVRSATDKYYYRTWKADVSPKWSLKIYQGLDTWEIYDNTSKWDECVLNTYSGTNENGGTFDSNFVNFIKQADGEQQIEDLCNQWWKSDIYKIIDDNDWGNRGHYKHYFNYYKFIVATYSQGPCFTHMLDTDLKDNYNSSQHHIGKGYHTDAYYINNKYAQFCNYQDHINFLDTYYWVCAEEPDDNGNLIQYIKLDDDDLPKMSQRFSAIKFYPLVENKEKVNFTDAFTTEERNKPEGLTIQDYINKLKASTPAAETATISIRQNDTGASYIEVINGDNVTCRYFIIHYEPYECGRLTWNGAVEEINPHRYILPWKTCTLSAYNIHTNQCLDNKDIIVPPQLPEEITKDIGSSFDATLHYVPASDSSMVRVSEQENHKELWAQSKEISWYTKNNSGDFERVYTVAQLFDKSYSSPSYFYLDSASISESLIMSSGEYMKEFIIYGRHYTVSADGTLIYDDTSTQYNCKIDISSLYSKTQPGDVESWTIKLKNNTTLTITATISKLYNITTMSNADFWYYFKDRLDMATICQQAAVIETELTTYWQQAYSASLFCRWFLPEAWQSSSLEDSVNYFSNLIYRVDASQRKLSLLNVLVPEVTKYNWQGDSVVTNYQFFYYTTDESAYRTNDARPVSTIPALMANDTVVQAINYIFGESGTNQLLAQSYGRTTYYTWVNGGTEHAQLARLIDGTQKVYEHYSGLYAMQLNRLLHQYLDQGDNPYLKLVEDKLLVWRQLYARYPGIFLENTYNNDDVRSSKQLMRMAELAFKDYTSPEKQYNISLIDAAALQGYQGQELSIGDGILLQTADYYTEMDETYRALNQYLYISDISYTLRTDADIALTVNTIKYQDKLLQSIVKLIR